MASSSTASAALAVLLTVGLAVLSRGAHGAFVVRAGSSLADIAYPGQFPWHAAVHVAGADANTLLGSGALVSQQYVLTAASILPEDAEKAKLEVVLGVVTLRQTGTRVGVKGVTKHDEWKPESRALHDLALLQLETSIMLPNDNTIALALLPPRFYRGATYKDQSVSVSSWGGETDDYKGLFLREVVVRVLSNRDCQSQRSVQTERVPRSQLCAVQAAGDDTLLGTADAGDPAVFAEPSGAYRLIGIVSAERQSASGRPTVLARITEHLDWIAANSDAIIG
ncbi:hypothetical protein FOCC_FOCC004592 [Frankliniella occidentalis]|uniref:Granzyme M-like n=1 Tax=Frankliniella occidentalis TaxID=133901 RepID=A0A6J1S1X8_FRAOC|nr:granzyme M-like [Frankliniella occidentalis]KAE8748789.1 hypothetical protein FOCC_FOCC004592 [Frankliniella occidentalis]